MLTSRFAAITATFLVAITATANTDGEEAPAQAIPVEIFPLPANTTFERDEVYGEGAYVTAGAADQLIYSNTLGPFGVAIGAGNLVADDITTTVPGGCPLVRYEFPVVGRVNPAGTGGTYTVDFAMYTACPHSVPPGSRPGLIIPGTQGQRTISDQCQNNTDNDSDGLVNDGCPAVGPAESGADCSNNVDDDGDAKVNDGCPAVGNPETDVGSTPRLISFVAAPNILLPTNFWFGVKFSRNNAGVIVGGLAMTGFSCDQWDFPGYPCYSNLGGFPGQPQASFNLEIFADSACSNSYTGYKNDKPSGILFNPGSGVYLADDIHLSTSGCDMIAYEVAVKGQGFYTFQMKQTCGSANIIAGTQQFWSQAALPDVKVVRFTFDPPIRIPQNLSFQASVNISTGSVVIAGQESCIGSTGYPVYIVGNNGCDIVYPYDLGVEHGAVNLTITCAGAAPLGACCDMVFTDVNNEAVCREVPRMNCPWPWPQYTSPDQPQWVEIASCDPDPFPFPCGAAACCRPDQVCENLTQNECNAVEPVDAPRIWQQGLYCEMNGQHCPFVACSPRRGDCLAARQERGCQDLECCTNVCNTDVYCCLVERDTICIREAQSLCYLAPGNDGCIEATEVASNSSAVVSNATATPNPGDPAFSCHRDGSGIPGFHSTWFAFEAMEASARIHTCNTDPPAQDTLLAIYLAINPSTPETVCASLSEIACSDDTDGCGADVGSEVCVTGLVPGQRYYIQVATHSEEDRGVFELDIESPCPAVGSESQGVAPTAERPLISMPTGASPARLALAPHTPLMNVPTLSAIRPIGPGAPGNQAVGPEMPQLVRIDIADMSQLRILAAFHDAHRDVEIWSEALGIGPMDVRLSSHTRQALDATGLSYRVLVEDLDSQRQALLSAPAGADFFDAYRSYDEHVAFLNDLVTAYPHLAEMVDLGSSVEGRTLWAIRITGPGADKPAVLYHGAQHGNEIMGAANIAFIARRLVTEYGIDSRVTALVDNVEWFLLSMMNPDGYEYGARYNANGYDLNRNWGGPGAYPAPFSQPETAALRDFLIAHPNVRAHVDLHSSGFMIMWPWGHTPELTEDHVTFESLATEMAGRIAGVRGTQYPYRGPIYTTIYPVNGGSVDYSYGELGLWSLVFEIGYTSYMPTYEIIPTSEEMFQSLAFLSEWVFDCNGNGVADADEIAHGDSDDCNTNNTPDECEHQPDFDSDGEIDICDADIDNDGVLNAADVCDRTPLGSAIAPNGRPLSDTTGQCKVGMPDYWRFRNCVVNGRLGFPAPAEACLSYFDYDGDGNVNLRDFAGFQNAFGGSGP